MLTPLTENGQEVCSQYWPDNGSVTSFGEFTIDNLGEESVSGFVIRQLSVLSEKVRKCHLLILCCLRTSSCEIFVASVQTQKAHQVTQFQITNWRSDGRCENFKTVTDINEEVIKVQRRTGNHSIVVHCK